MEYIIIWALFNVKTGEIKGPFLDLPSVHYSANECGKALIEKGAQKPDQDGNIKLFECIVPGERPTAKYIQGM